ncbi:MAG: hypothetical protein NZM15_01090 [Flavobacteriales bacterium]|nr:hypothetical protein [Flavobacteriales bacterium]MDW8431278.1 hypothetical protein [Flavobacteriales bacterium]
MRRAASAPGAGAGTALSPRCGRRDCRSGSGARSSPARRHGGGGGAKKNQESINSCAKRREDPGGGA